MDAFWNFMTITATLGVAVIPVAWAWHYDRYRKNLNSHEQWVSWIQALDKEVDHQFHSLEEMEEAIEVMLKNEQFCIIFKRFNEDLFQTAREQIIQHQRASHVFPLLTRTYRDTTHTNAMLDRLEASIHKNGDYSSDAVSHMIGSSVRGSLVGVRDTLTSMKQKLTAETELFPSNKPTIFTAQ
ncbi:hypothetical protein JIN77_02180 [Verrucomicrobiaceae bacterium R5-34]|nr:hypothetical protein [Verrucomicrobiaceae bacterium R5-34]